MWMDELTRIDVATQTMAVSIRCLWFMVSLSICISMTHYNISVLRRGSNPAYTYN